MNQVYEYVTNQIIQQLERGNIPWKQSWASSGLPVNGISKKPYQGINPFLLMTTKYNNPNWFTYKQVEDLGGHVRKGEKSTMVIFWKKYAKEDQNKQEGEISNRDKEVLVLRYYRVFNYLQTEGLNQDKFESKDTIVFNPIESVEKIIREYKQLPTIVYNEQRAYYNPGQDIINMPRKESFKSETDYYQTLFHEMIHSTGHEKRLNRLQKKEASFGSSNYSKEELIAEIGASFLSGVSNISNNEQIEQSAAYIQGWLQALKNDKTMVVKAAAQAQKASDYIITTI